MTDLREAMRALRRQTEPDAARLARVRRLSRRPRRAPFVLATALAAAVLCLAWPRSVPLHAGPLTTGALTDDVAIVADGTGLVHGDAGSPVLRWEDGRLEVEVTPDQGVDLVVETDEARIAVIGTGFVVTRDALGTRVDVRHGRVRTVCTAGAAGLAAGTPTELGVGATVTCLPVSPARRLGRILTLRDQGASAEVLVAELDAAEAVTPSPDPLRAELALVRIGLLLDHDRAAAERIATVALADPGAREADLRRLVAQLRVAAGDCPGARPHLEWLTAHGQLTPEDPLPRACPSE